MLKRFLCGAALLGLLSGAMTTPSQAEELYVRNKLFKDAYFFGSTTYVPVDGFLRAVDVPWTVDGTELVLGTGDSPDWTPVGDQFRASHKGENLEVTGIVRGGRLYVPAKELAEFVGYGVLYNQDTGIVDIVKARMTNASDEKAAADVTAMRQAEKEARDAAWQARVDKARADRKAKADAANEGEEGDGDVLDAKGDEDKDPSDSAPQTGEDETAPEAAEADEEAAEPEPPPVANLVVLSSEAFPNNYTGEVVFRAVVQNQGNAPATDVKAKFVVVGPDGKEWVNRTMYHSDVQPDGRWEITENYRHRLGAAIPRGDYNVNVVPTFESAAPK